MDVILEATLKCASLEQDSQDKESVIVIIFALSSSQLDLSPHLSNVESDLIQIPGECYDLHLN